MAAKTKHGLEIYDLLIELIVGLSPRQAETLYSELLPRYTKRAKTHLYNSEGVEDKENGKVRLLPNQYRTLRVKYGDTYIKRAFTELTNYIEFLEKNQDVPKYKTKLKDYMSKTHNLILDSGWVYEKCKQWKTSAQVKLNINPYEIDDFHTAKEYIKNIPKDIRDSALDVQMLLMKFPELSDVEYERGSNDR